ncbi:expansin EXLX1 family cellulose-binding protein [Actinoplanes oblitus]|uniref:Expansin EXLX1 family cellulose-binding protein n=1 Tax=Actinoplanes oblitus TaxID=3040509 RepID=A0ABY8WHV7_9ACTN|nr:expansin EXLX1 family cellulose-binding protein [Actinoplanes oblitus]WIM97461.1 expansin EXLX1 family cellulose-binding protein [Actinoplanes oblitus]
MSAHRRPFPTRWLAAGGAAALAGIIGVALLLQTGGSACAAPPSTSTKTGKATFYELGGTTGNCSFEVPADDLYVALGPEQYAEGASCGAYLDVTGPKGKVRVKVFDSCPECQPGHLDLSRTAFKKIGAEVAGVVSIKYRLVTNPSTPGPITVQLKDGASKYWFAARIDNHGNLLSSVQVAGPGGSFKSAHRTDYNYWLIDGGAGSGPYKIKITDVYGNSTTVTGIDLDPGAVQKTSKTLTGGSRVVEKATSPTPTAKKSSPTSKPTTKPSKPATVSPPASSVAPLPASVAAAPSTTGDALVALAAGETTCD